MRNNNYSQHERWLALTGIAIDELGQIIGVGERNYKSVVLNRDARMTWHENHLPRGWLTDAVCTGQDDFWVSARMGDIWRGSPTHGFQKVSPAETSTDFNAIASYEGRIYLAAPDAELWIFDDEELSLLKPFTEGDELFASSFEQHSGKLWLQGENGFGVFDGETWTRIEVPW